MEVLAGMAHTEGIRFSPYTHVDPDKDIVLTPDELRNAMEMKEPRVWGNFDGSGEPIRLSFDDYYNQFVFDHDYTMADEVSMNRVIGQGNTKNNIQEIYPGAYVVEYHFDGFDPKVEGMDWTSLRVVFVQEQEDWRLRAIVHDQWTI
jgi:hypothetical protein